MAFVIHQESSTIALHDTCRSPGHLTLSAQMYQIVRTIINEQLKWFLILSPSHYNVQDHLICAHPESRFRRVERMRNSDKMTLWPNMSL